MDINQNESEFIAFFERISRKKWQWILVIAIMMNFIGCFIHFLFEVIKERRIELTLWSLVETFLWTTLVSFPVAFMIYKEQERRYKKLKGKQ